MQPIEATDVAHVAQIFLCTHVNNYDVQEDCVVIHVNSNYRMRHILINLKVLCRNIL